MALPKSALAVSNTWSQSVVQDPRDAKREEARGWMNENKDKLEQQVGSQPGPTEYPSRSWPHRAADMAPSRGTVTMLGQCVKLFLRARRQGLRTQNPMYKHRVNSATSVHDSGLFWRIT